MHISRSSFAHASYRLSLFCSRAASRASTLGLLSALAACDPQAASNTDGEPKDKEAETTSENPSSASNAAPDDAASTGSGASSEDASSGATTSAASDGGAQVATNADAAVARDAGAARDAGTARDAGGNTTNDAGGAQRDAGPVGRTCGGFAALECGAGQFCNYEAPRGQGCDGQIADAAGVCETAPQACTLQYDPVCGCDGKTYGNACGAHSAGVSVATRGECATEATSCDRRALLCKRAEPVCPAGQVASIVGTCFGDCVAIDQCACSEPEACPQPERYTCHRSAMHCGPYVN